LSPTDLALTEGWEPDESFGTGHRRQLSVIFDAIRSGAEAPVPGIEARKAIQIITTIYRSAASGKAIDLREGS
jgi:predicted dehydrogenase